MSKAKDIVADLNVAGIVNGTEIRSYQLLLENLEAVSDRIDQDYEAEATIYTLDDGSIIEWSNFSIQACS